MSSIKISELEEVTAVASSDIFPIVSGGTTKKAPLNKLEDMFATRTYVNDQIADIPKVQLDDTVTESSQNGVKSSGIYSYVNEQIGTINSVLSTLTTLSGVNE